jgi:hypothetical protein
MPIAKSVATFCGILLLTLVLKESVIAQQEEPRFEVGAQFSVIGRRVGGATSIGGGGRLTFNLTKYLALEAELNSFPSAGINDVRRFQGQFGAKSGWRFDSFGVFGKLRPGFISAKYNVQTICLQPVCLPNGVCSQPFPFPCSLVTVKDTGFSVDVGGVLEFYPSKRIILRFDAGDTIGNQPFATHNLQLSVGVGFRF